jgi:hypothetical protein
LEELIEKVLMPAKAVLYSTDELAVHQKIAAVLRG